MIVSSDDPPQQPGSNTNSAQEEAETNKPWEIDDPSPGLLESPIDFLFAEHNRQRQAANALHLVADGEVNDAGVEKLIGFLQTDFAIHVADEELCFFPLLQQHCLPEDNIGKLIERLAEEHKKDEATVSKTTAVLRGLLAGEKLNSDIIRAIRSFAEHVLQHLALENAILLPIARARLNEAALHTLSGMMKERRARHQG